MEWYPIWPCEHIHKIIFWMNALIVFTDCDIYLQYVWEAINMLGKNAKEISSIRSPFLERTSKCWTHLGNLTHPNDLSKEEKPGQYATTSQRIVLHTQFFMHLFWATFWSDVNNYLSYFVKWGFVPFMNSPCTWTIC